MYEVNNGIIEHDKFLPFRVKNALFWKKRLRCGNLITWDVLSHLSIRNVNLTHPNKTK